LPNSSAQNSNEIFTLDFRSRIALTINFKRTITMATKASFSPDAGLAAIATVLSRALGARLGVDTLKTIAMLCSAGLVVLLLLATFGNQWPRSEHRIFLNAFDGLRPRSRVSGPLKTQTTTKIDLHETPTKPPPQERASALIHQPRKDDYNGNQSQLFPRRRRAIGVRRQP